MLQGSFYTVEEVQPPTPGVIVATIRLNPAHPIFEGHFPGMPVVPGVCMLQIVKECLEERLGFSLLMMRASNLKFLTVLTPRKHEVVGVRINFESSEDGILVSEASISSGTTRFVKMQQVRYATPYQRNVPAAIPLRQA
ncbi:MAG: 3-hydroxyacyl-ACP dehydratase [Hymenobacter sp.]|jgi:3-hydroxyacyl-[acyl-carrier-protein] dehydratase|nr:3-hydroxyacyl-ACP dehydratase [Hymenobacter sp.]